MKIKRIAVGSLGTNCYIAYDENKKEGIVIDPGANGERIISHIKALGIDIKYIVFTHVHFDHILAFFDVKGEYPSAKLIVADKEKDALYDDEKSLIRYARSPQPEIKYDLTVKDGDIIKFGDEAFEVIETPGHTEGSICLYSNKILISGDTLFNYSIGRCDFPTGSLSKEINSIINILFKLPPETKVYPGHGDETTIEFEKQHNEVYLWKGDAFENR